jgi:hypothetical protein
MDYCDYVEMDAVVDRHIGDDTPEPGTLPCRLGGPNPQICRYCGIGDLWWQQTQAKTWRLHDESGAIHTCVQYGKKPKQPNGQEPQQDDEDIPD